MTPQILLIIFLVVVGLIWLVTKNKEEKKTVNVRPYKKTITVKGYSRSKSKPKKKNRSSGKR
jgi:hypothetical protein